MAGNRLSDMAGIVEDLDAMGRLIRVRSEVDPHLELAGVAARFEGGPRAVLFENVKGHDAPVLTGLYWSRELLAALMGRDEHTLAQYVSGCIREWQRRPVAPVMVDHGPIYEGQSVAVDLRRIPAPVHALQDGGPYFDAGVVIAADPETGVRNASIQRFMVVDERTLHVNIDAGRHLELYLDKARARGETLPFSLNCAVGPRPALRGGHPGRGRTRRHRRAGHRQRLPRSPPGAGRGQGATGARRRQRDVRARMRDRSRRAR